MAPFFVRRPIVAMVISIVIVLAGLVSLTRLPIAQLPDIAPPEIAILASYTGADSLTVEGSVAAPIEQQMTGVDNMLYMRSYNNSDGSMQLRVTFDITTDPNIDQVNAQTRLSNAMSQLPRDVQAQGLTIRKTSVMPVMGITIISPKGTYDHTFLSNYAYINLNDPLSRLQGVGDVQVYGAGQYAMRLWLKPDQLAKLGLTVSDISKALQSQNVVNPAGQVGAEPVPAGQEFTYSMRAQGRLVSAEEFGDIVLRENPDGSIVRVRDVARVELGAQRYDINTRLNGDPAGIILVYQLPGANAVETAHRVRVLMAELAERFPEDLTYVVSYDATQAVREGIKEIVITLIEALVLVILVVFIFLQSWRATLIPLVTVPVSLIGTLIFFVPLGFSINTLSLFGLVLAIGLVVDDAIVVVEAVERHIEHGLSPREATLKAMGEVTAPVVAIALILVAVFVPSAFIPGITGRLYQQFALTIAISVAISAFNALTLSPALCALLLRPRTPSHGPLARFFAAFNRIFGRETERYVKTSSLAIRKARSSMLFLAVIGVLAFVVGGRLPTAFLPNDDQGYFFVDAELPAAASLQRATDAVGKIETVLKETPGIRYNTSIIGFSLLNQVHSTYSLFSFITLEPWHKRTTSKEQIGAIISSVNARLAQLPDAVAFAFMPPAIPGVGTSGGFTIMIEDRGGNTPDYLGEHVNAFIEAARKRPEIASANTAYNAHVPQIYVKVDRDKVFKQGIDVREVYETLQAYMGGLFVNYFNRFGRVWQVYIEAEGEYRKGTDDIGQFYVRNAKGQMVPLATLVTLERSNGPEFTTRFNEYRAAQVVGSVAPGYGSGEVQRALEETARAVLPKDMGYDWYGMSYQEWLAGQGVSPTTVFAISLLFVFLIMAAQYESWSLPLAVLLATPVAVFGAFAALWIRGMENNVYTQIGLVMLIGLAAKNAILIVEFAKAEFDDGKDVVEAALAGARLRLRPILMTALAFIFGVVPLAIATGAGAGAREILGTTVMGGMLASSLLGIIIAPVAFVVVMKLGRVKRRPRGAAAADAPELPPAGAE